MREKKPIDRLRDSAFKMQIGTADDSSSITTMISIGDVLYTVKENGIYAVSLADSIDPSRLNPNIPNVQQRVLTYGSESEIVGRTFLTANSLCKKAYLPPTFDCEQALMRSLDALKDIVVMHEEMKTFQSSEQKEIDAFKNRPQVPGSLVMPAVGNVLGHCKTFFQKADHVSQSLFSIVKMFYKKDVGAGGFDSLTELAKRKYGESDAFTKFANDVAPKLKYIRNVRNSLEHPQSQPPIQMANVHDFVLGADGRILPPMMEVVYRKERYSPVPISWLMENSVEGLSLIFENMLAYLCSKHVQKFSNFPTRVIELPPERRQSENKHVRYCYGVQIGEQVLPIG